MQHHGLGHLPQPDNFTTCGRLGIEINQVQIIEIFLHEVADIFTSQYNNPVECYADDTIEEQQPLRRNKRTLPMPRQVPMPWRLMPSRSNRPRRR